MDFNRAASQQLVFRQTVTRMSRPGVHLTTVAVERPYDLRGSFHRNPLRAAVRPRLACHSLAETQSRSAGKDSAEAAGSGRRATHGGRCVKRRDTDGGAASSVSRTVFGRNRSIYARDTDEKGVSSVSRRENGMKAGGHFGFQPTVRVAVKLSRVVYLRLTTQ